MNDELDPKDLDEETIDDADLEEAEDELGVKKGKKDFDEEDSLEDLADAEEEDVDGDSYDDDYNI
jgi:hypothetical protein